jgi:hypothetical protein
MAEGKNSILIYTDWIDTFESLSDEEAGKLVKHLFRYVNDKNPIPPDRLTEISFIPIKNSLKRDLKKWELELERKSDGGRLGNLKRWHLDLYELVIKKEITIEKAEEIGRGRIKSHTDAQRQNQSLPIASIADSVLVPVSVTVPVIENNSFPKKRKKITIEEYVKENKETLSEIFKEFPTIKKSANLWLEYKFKKKGYKETKWANVMVERIKCTSIAFIEKRIIETIAGETYEDYFYSNHQVEFDKQNKTQTFTPSQPKKQMTNEERRRA